MEIADLEPILKAQTDRVIEQLDYYKRGYLDALTFIAGKIAKEVKPDAENKTESPN